MESSEKQKNIQTGKTRQFCTFVLSERLFGVDILAVREVNSTAAFTPIFHAPKEIKGYFNIRGQIHLILDLRQLLGYTPAVTTSESRLVLFKPEVGENFGVLVDRIGEAVSVQENQIEEWNKEAPEESGAETQGMANLSLGVCKLDKILMLILDPQKFLKAFKTD
ncbi:MAG: chemotaxis protein CheW [Desulfobacterales bacterium]